MAATIAEGSLQAPPALPLVGHAPAFVRDKLGFLRRTHQQYGDAVRLTIGTPVWLLNDPEDIEHLLVRNAYNYEKSPKLTSPRGRRLSGSGLHTATGAEHLPKRRLVQPLFHRSVVDSHTSQIIQAADQMLSGWQEETEIELLGAMMRLSQQILIRALFGEEFEDPGDRFASALTTRRRYIEYFFTSNLPLPEYLPVPIVFGYRRAIKHIHKVIAKEITRRRQSEAPGRDMLSMLVAARRPDGSEMTDLEIRDEAVTLTSTGYETIGAALAWTWHLLALNPQIQQAVRDESRWMVSADASDPDHIQNMALTRNVLNESLRLYPPTWIFVRVAIGDDQLPSGLQIREGDKIYLCPYTMHRHDRYYPDPERFDPERFSVQAIKQRPKFSFFPFGGGAKLCIGEPLARLEAMAVIARMAQKFSFSHAGTHKVIPRPSIVLEPRGGLRMRLAKPGYSNETGEGVRG